MKFNYISLTKSQKITFAIFQIYEWINSLKFRINMDYSKITIKYVHFLFTNVTVKGQSDT